MPHALPRLLSLLLAIASLCAAGCGGERRGPSVDSNTNWLTRCTDDSRCADGLACVCGSCTPACSAAADCAASGMSCLSAPHWNANRACRSTAPSAGPSYCGETCDVDHPCSADGFLCVTGLCVPLLPVPTPDGGSVDLGSSVAVSPVRASRDPATEPDRTAAPDAAAELDAGAGAALLPIETSRNAVEPTDAGAAPPPGDVRLMVCTGERDYGHCAGVRIVDGGTGRTIQAIEGTLYPDFRVGLSHPPDAGRSAVEPIGDAGQVAVGRWSQPDAGTTLTLDLTPAAGAFGLPTGRYDGLPDTNGCFTGSGPLDAAPLSFWLCFL